MTKVTAEQKVEILEVYGEGKESGDSYEILVAIVKDLADDLELSEAQVRGVLVSEKVYVSKPKAAKAATGMDKEALVKAYSALAGVDVPSFKNVSKKDLEAFWERLMLMVKRAEIGES